MNAEILKSLGMNRYVDEYDKHICPLCHKPVDESEFVKEVERKEYKISGMCKHCQDEFFETK